MKNNKIYLYFAWILSLSAMLGSLFYSEIMHYTPCVLCWYQRILMYPIVILLPIGILKKDHKIYQYILPLSIMGMLVAIYHILIQNGLIPQSIAPCVIGASCSLKQVGYFGFITIPVMAFITFSLITLNMWIYKKNQK